MSRIRPVTHGRQAFGIDAILDLVLTHVEIDEPEILVVVFGVEAKCTFIADPRRQPQDRGTMLCCNCFVVQQQAASKTEIGEWLLNIEPIKFCRCAARGKGLHSSNRGLSKADESTVVCDDSDKCRRCSQKFGEGFSRKRLPHFVCYFFGDACRRVSVQKDLCCEHAQAQGIGRRRWPEVYVVVFGVQCSGAARKAFFAA